MLQNYAGLCSNILVLDKFGFNWLFETNKKGDTTSLLKANLHLPLSWVAVQTGRGSICLLLLRRLCLKVMSPVQDGSACLRDILP